MPYYILLQCVISLNSKITTQNEEENFIVFICSYLQKVDRYKDRQK